MPAITATRELALFAAKDTADAFMRREGRTKWNRQDYATACRVFNRLWPGESAIRAVRAARKNRGHQDD